MKKSSKKSSSKPLIIREIPSKIKEIKKNPIQPVKKVTSLEEEVDRIEKEVTKEVKALSQKEITPSLLTQLSAPVQTREQRSREETKTTREEKKEDRPHVYGETRKTGYLESDERKGYMENRSKDYDANVTEREDDKKRRERLGTRGDGLMNTQDDRADQYTPSPGHNARADVYDVSSSDKKRKNHVL